MSTLSVKLAEAIGIEDLPSLDEALPALAQDVIDNLSAKWLALWRRARNKGLDSLRTRDKVLLFQGLEAAAEKAGYKTPLLKARAVDQVLAYAV